jgi:hypothetical protein
MFKKILLACSISVPFILDAQELPHPTNIAAAIKKQTRTLTGAPGKNYWQNTAVYDLKINFDPVTRLLKGEATIDYTNNSPDNLRQMVWKLYPNLYEKTSPRSMPVKDADLSDGVVIESMTLNGNPLNARDVDGTNMNIALPKPILHGQTARFTIAWYYTLNKGSHIRTGEIDPGADFVAYFFRASRYMMILMVGTIILIWANRNFIMISVILKRPLRCRQHRWYGQQAIC